ncbi:argininosuccinate synthase [Candidatus Saccharibacteria bacterium]|nr:argininosuccinate synthase [Candidatus Saccharibacteria bacterium]
MNNSPKKYTKVSSYEAHEGEVKKVVLLYSGGLDTSMMLKWIQEEYNAEVVALTIDIGQQKDDLEAARKKALRLGAVEAIVVDAKAEFAEKVLAKGIKANASYQGGYHLSTPMGRVMLAEKAVEAAHKTGADAIAHGATGKGNDQVRIEGYCLAIDPSVKILAPVREWDMDRRAQIQYAKDHGIEVPASIDFPYSVDDNMWGMTWEGGEIEDPAVIAPTDKFLTAYTSPKNAPEKPELVKITFEEGLPVAVNGEKLPLHDIVKTVNDLGGKHGVGIIHLIEDRVVGVKNGGIYEMPGARILVEAHKALERYVSTRALNEIKETLDIKWAYLCYGAQWYDPAMRAINALNDEVNKVVDGTVTVQLFKGSVHVAAMESPNGLDFTSFNKDEGVVFNVNASAGFIEIYTQQMRTANQHYMRKSK